MSTNIEFMLKNQMLSSFQTGNTMFDMILGMLICSAIASLTSIVNYDKIKIQHEALSRDSFAVGSILAARWIINKKGIFKMDDILGF